MNSNSRQAGADVPGHEPQIPPGAPGSRGVGAAALSPHYKWIALSNTTLGVLMATINQSIVLIRL